MHLNAYLLCGKVGAGKTTYALELESHGAMRSKSSPKGFRLCLIWVSGIAQSARARANACKRPARCPCCIGLTYRMQNCCAA